MVGMLLAGVFAVTVDSQPRRTLPQTVRLFLLSLTAGLCAYVTVGLQVFQVHKLPGLSDFPPEWQTPMISTLFALVPLLWAAWQRRQQEL